MIASFFSRRPMWILVLAAIGLPTLEQLLPHVAAADLPKPAATSAADEPRPSNLDNALLQDLDIPAQPEANTPSRTGRPAELPADGAAESDALLLEQLGAGEDLGQPSEQILVTIGRRMRLAESLIARQVTSQKTQRVQQQVIQDLERAIEELTKQSQGAQAGAPSSAKPGAKPDGKSRAGSGENTGASRPAKESTDRIDGAASDREQLAQLQMMLKEVWGHLPPKIRDQMQTATIEEFLPKYEQLIEAYYSRLAEDDTR